jgi:vancomycin resistance protein YoaR
MDQDAPPHDATVRMPGDRPAFRPPLHPSRPAARSDAAAAPHGADDGADATRPVTNDWMFAAPAFPATDAAGTGSPDPSAQDSPGASAQDREEAGVDLEQPVTDEEPHDVEAVDDEPPAGHEPSAGPSASWWRRRAVLVPAAAVLALGAVYGVDLLAADGSIPRSTTVAGIDIGGLSPAAATSRLEHDLGARERVERTLVADRISSTVSPAAAGLTFDIPATVRAASRQPLAPWARVAGLVSDRTVPPVVATDQAALTAELDAVAAKVDRAPVDATIAFTGTTPHVVPPADGLHLDRASAARALTAALTGPTSSTAPILVPVRVTSVHVDAAAAQRTLDSTVIPALAGPVRVVGASGNASVEVPVQAIAASLVFTPQVNGTLAMAVDPAALQKALGSRLQAFGRPATDARFDVTGGTVRVVPSTDGTGLAPATLAHALLPALKAGAERTVTAVLGPVHAAFTTEQATALGITEKVSSFTTHFANTASGTNIRVVAAKVDGALVKPGATFSLNGYTGPRGTAQGYVPAAVISGGQLSKAVGGGISQFATTMFNAMYFAGLQDVHHKTHSFYISRYPAGREATVYEGLIDLAWKNDSPTGIVVDTQWSPGTLTVTFYGTRHYDITSIEGPHTSITQPAVENKIDTDGSCIKQSGVPGFDVTVTRVFHDLRTGAELRRQNFHTHYSPEAIIHCLPPTTPPSSAGTAAPSPAPGG